MKGGALKLSTKKSQIKFSQQNQFLGEPEAIRTPDLQLRRLLLYPAELRARKEIKNVFLKRALKNLDFHWENNHILSLRVKTTLHNVRNMVKKNLSKNVFVVKDEFRSEE